MEYEAEVCVWFKVKFIDNEADAIRDQAYESAQDWLGVPIGRLDDLEIVNVEATA